MTDDRAVNELLHAVKALDERVKAIELSRAEETGERRGRAKTFGGVERMLGIAFVLMQCAILVETFVGRH